MPIFEFNQYSDEVLKEAYRCISKLQNMGFDVFNRDMTAELEDEMANRGIFR